jgi:hypothetical protein
VKLEFTVELVTLNEVIFVSLLTFVKLELAQLVELVAAVDHALQLRAY